MLINSWVFSFLQYLLILKIGYSSTLVFKVSVIHDLIQSQGWLCKDIVRYFVDRIVEYDPNIRSVTNFNPNVFRRAQELDEFYAHNYHLIGHLHCVPVIIKENIDIANMSTNAGVKVLRNSVPVKNARVIDRLLNQGAVILAKANMAQLAVGINYDSEIVGLCKNPFNLNRTCSASSSGSAASVSSGLAVISLGTDTSGSIIAPASYNGVYALRPPYNPNQTEGILPLDSTIDTVGPFAKHLEDIVLTYSIIENKPQIYDHVFKKNFAFTDLKIKIIKEFMEPINLPGLEFIMDPEVKPIVKKSVERIKSLGIQVVEVNLSTQVIQNMIRLLKDLETSYMDCLSSFSCYAHSFNVYFSDTTRYESDAPVKNFKQFYESPFLNPFWHSLINQTKLDLSKINNNTYLDQICSQSCGEYNKIKAKFTYFVDMFILEDEYDGLFLPSLATIPPLHENILASTQGSKQDSFIYLSVYTGKGNLVLPSGFTESSEESPDGLPVSMCIVHNDQKIENVFKIAKLYENKESFYKLPYTVPLIDYVPSTKVMSWSHRISSFLRNFLTFF
jgi:Asp-tRNA(Asn)/Glu-tRNA(Gln) amidotransferase A subunit family amidase